MTKTYTIETRTSYVSATADPADLVHKDSYDINAALADFEVEVTYNRYDEQFASPEEAGVYIDDNVLANINHVNGVFEIERAEIWEVTLDEDGEPEEYEIFACVHPQCSEYAHMLAYLVVRACECDGSMTIQGKTYDGIDNVVDMITAWNALEDAICDYMLGVKASVVVTSESENFIFDK